MKVEIYNELKDKAPLLSSIEKKHLFDIPENYFEQLPSTIQQKIKQPKTNLIKTLLSGLLKPQFAVGLFVILLVGSLYMFNQHKADNQYAFVAVNVDSLNVNELSDLLDTDQLESIVPADNNADAETINYLIENYNDLSYDINNI